MSKVFSINGNPKWAGDGGGGAVLYPDTMFAPQGWVCPKCGRVYSPFMPMCLYCGDEVNVTVTTDTKTAVEAFERASEVNE